MKKRNPPRDEWKDHSWNSETNRSSTDTDSLHRTHPTLRVHMLQIQKKPNVIGQTCFKGTLGLPLVLFTHTQTHIHTRLAIEWHVPTNLSLPPHAHLLPHTCTFTLTHGSCLSTSPALLSPNVSHWANMLYSQFRLTLRKRATFQPQGDICS